MEEQKTSGKAIASLICGVFRWFLPALIAAIVLGHLSLSEIRKSAGRFEGSWNGCGRPGAWLCGRCPDSFHSDHRRDRHSQSLESQNGGQRGIIRGFRCQREQFGTTDSNPHAITLRDALTSLASLCLMQYKVDEKTTLTKLPQPSANQAKILTALAVPLPEKM
jgi:hypothetical protein